MEKIDNSIFSIQYPSDWEFIDTLDWRDFVIYRPQELSDTNKFKSNLELKYIFLTGLDSKVKNDLVMDTEKEITRIRESFLGNSNSFIIEDKKNKTRSD